MFNPSEHLIELKGKQYLQVMWRLVWFREDKPLWNIDTKLEHLTADHAVFSAKVSDENGVQKASGYGSESAKDFNDFIEKAETKAIGRALAMLGYGTQFAPELDEGRRIVDAPAPPPAIRCERCGHDIEAYKAKGKVYTPEEVAETARKAYGSVLCWACMKAVKADRAREEAPDENAG